MRLLLGLQDAHLKPIIGVIGGRARIGTATVGIEILFVLALFRELRIVLDKVMSLLFVVSCHQQQEQT